jgi:hypothetical protein
MFPCDDEGYYCADMSSHYLETWDAMEALVDEGLTRSIGLSNFNRYFESSRFSFSRGQERFGAFLIKVGEFDILIIERQFLY